MAALAKEDPLCRENVVLIIEKVSGGALRFSHSRWAAADEQERAVEPIGITTSTKI
jgi:hypothetical protein